jgi:Kef-type K+ transport system membrane component KefB
MEQELITLGILFSFALVGGILATRFKQPILLGLLLVGALIGPKAFGLIHDEHMMEPMIEFGAILMLFVLGLEFDIPRLKKIGVKAILIAVLNSALLTFIGFIVSVTVGFDIQTALFMGVILAFGSTVVIVKVLENKGMMERQEVPLLIAILIIEDIIAVMVITFFSGMSDKSSGLLNNIEGLILSMIALVVAYALFVRFIRPILAWVLKGNSSEEITVFTSLALCAGFAYFAYALKLSPAVGAFLAGSIVASLPNSKQFEHAVAPYNLIISSFFFIAIGTLIDFAAIKANIMIILILVATVMITKIIAFSGLVYFFANMKGDKMFFSSVAMFSVGEFSLLVAKEATKFNIGVDLVSIAAAIVAASAILMSLVINYSDRMYAPTMENMPYSLRKKMESASAYIKNISDELDSNAKNSENLKKNITKAGIGFLGSLMIMFGWRRLANYLVSQNVAMSTINTGIIITMILIASSLFYSIYNAKKISRIFAEIFGNATNTRNAIQNRKIVAKAFWAITNFTLILAMPFILFMIGAPRITTLIPVALLLVLAWQIYSLSKLAKGYNNDYYSTSKKFEYSVTHHNTGWKI